MFKWFGIKQSMNPQKLVPSIGSPPSYEYRYLREKEKVLHISMYAHGLGDGGQYRIERRLTESDNWEYVTVVYKEARVEEEIKACIARDVENWRWSAGPKEIYLGRRP